MSHKLTMRFTTEEDGKNFSLAIDNIKEDANGQPVLTETDVSNLMDTIVSKKVFLSKTGAIIGKKDAKIVSTSSQNFDLK